MLHGSWLVTPSSMLLIDVVMVTGLPVCQEAAFRTTSETGAWHVVLLLENASVTSAVGALVSVTRKVLLLRPVVSVMRREAGAAV